MSEYSRHMPEVALALLGEPREKRGHEWRYGTHGSLALQVDKGTWYSHEEESGGGVLDLIQRETGAASIADAIRWLETQGYEQPSEPPARPAARPAAAKPKPRARIVETYDYCDENGELRYQVVRMEPKDFRQRKPEGDGWSWKVKGLDPLPYRLPDIIARPKASILIVEGEKDADRLAAMGFVATCNSGGANKWRPELNQYFQRRNVIIIPDNDEPGRKHVDTVGAALSGVAESIRVVYLPGLAEKQDVSDWLDAGGTYDDLIAACKAAEQWRPRVTEEAEQPPEEPAPANEGRPFRALGYNGSTYYYLPRGTEQVAEVGRAGHTSAANLLALAPIEWWEMAYPSGGDKGGVDWQLAASDCMRRCERVGVYDARNIRGRGAWYDTGASVLHLGDRLIVGGEVRQIAQHESQYIYTRQSAMESIINAQASSDSDSLEVFNLIQQLHWSKKVHGWLASGFILLAPICGALQWRPHVWLTSQRGAGKSWVQDNIVKPMLGQSALVVQGNTTEAGIRQSLKQDARPIVFDEAESEDASSQRRMKGVIELARQSSSDSSAEIVKGTADGSGMAFRIRSMFFLGSINVSLSQAADESRFTVLSLDRPPKTAEEVERFAEFKRQVSETLTDERCAAMRARAYELIPVIRQNAETLGRAVAEQLGSQRIGDQIGTLLAGAVAYSRSDAISLEDARKWAAQIDLSEAQEAEGVSDEEMCLQAIMQHQVPVEIGRGRVTRALSELVMGAAAKRALAEQFYSDDCNAVLERYGLRVDGSVLLVSNTHMEIKRILRDTPWAASWSRILKRLPGAESAGSPQRFAGNQTRAVRVPLSDVIA